MSEIVSNPKNFTYPVDFKTQSNFYWRALQSTPGLSYSKILDEAEKFWANDKDKFGFRSFNRWKYFWDQRLDEYGQQIRPDIVDRVLKDLSMTQSQEQNWTYIGNMQPVDWYMSESKGGSVCGRVSNLKSLPGSTMSFLACTSGGGLWKTTNYGRSWNPLTDSIGSLGITDVEIDPNNPDIIYIATGDANGQTNYSVGILKSTDGGDTWNATGLNFEISEVTTISKVVISPTNSNILIAATSEGIWRTTDAGENWTNVFNAPEAYAPILDEQNIQTGTFSLPNNRFRDIKMKPGDPNIWYAASRQLYKSENGGIDWYPTGTSSTPSQSIPSALYCTRIEIAVTPANPEVVYLGIVGDPNYFQHISILGNWVISGAPDTNKLLGIFKSSDSGVTFQKNYPYTFTEAETGGDTGSEDYEIDWFGSKGSDSGVETSTVSQYSPNLAGNMGHFAFCISVDPQDENFLVVGGLYPWISSDGGFTWKRIWDSHPDYHQIIFLESNESSKLIVHCNDGGLYLSRLEKVSNIWETKSVTNFSSNIGVINYYRLSTAREDSHRMVAGAADAGTHLSLGSTLKTSDDSSLDLSLSDIFNNHKYQNVFYHIYGGDGMECRFDPVDDNLLYVSLQESQFKILKLDSKALLFNNGFWYLKYSDSLTLHPNVTDNDYSNAQTGAWVGPMDIDSEGSFYISRIKILKTNQSPRIGILNSQNQGVNIFSNKLKIESGELEYSSGDFPGNSVSWRPATETSAWPSLSEEEQDQGSHLYWFGPHTFTIAPSNKNIIYASRSRVSNTLNNTNPFYGGGVFWGGYLEKSIDNGLTYQVIPSGIGGTGVGFPRMISKISIHDSDEDKVWISLNGYTEGEKIYYTDNGGQTWQNISGNLPNLACHVVRYQPGSNNGIYVGTDAGVFYRDDDLNDFIQYNKGLPNSPVTDMDIDVNNNIITICTYGRGIWRAPLYTS